jgi:transposase
LNKSCSDPNLLEGMEDEEAARLAGLSRSAAYEWHNRYEEDGIEGLRDRPRPGRQPRVDAVTSARFKERIVAGAELQRDGVVAFRAVDAQRILKEEFELIAACRAPTGCCIGYS